MEHIKSHSYDHNKDKFYNSLQNFHSKYAPTTINIPKYGIPLDNLYKPDESLITELKCSICLNLIWRARECNNCGNSYCECCIKESIRKSGDFCPLCKITPFDTREAKGLNKFFSKIRIKCIHDNCNEKPEYFDYLNHIENCKYRLYHCNNEGCEYEDILDNIKYHSNECKFRIVKCKFCSKEIKERNFQKHEKTECKSYIECNLCHLTMARGFYWTNHFSENNENISCLKGQIEYHKIINNQTKENNDRLKKNYETEILKYKNEIKKLQEENDIKKKRK